MESKNPPAEGGRTILIAVDESVHSKEAFEWILKNMYRKEDKLIIFHGTEMNLNVNAPRTSTTVVAVKDGLHLPYTEWKKVIKDSIKIVEDLMAEYEADLVSRKVHYKIISEHYKNIGEAIIMEAAKEKANIIVVGTRGLSCAKRHILGSVSDYVVHHTNLPVIVCPSSKTE